MRDVVAAIVALALLIVALSLATTLQRYRLARQRARDSERALGRTIIAELPTVDDMVLFSEDQVRFYYGERAVDKDLITAVRVLINGAPIAAVVSARQTPKPLHRSPGAAVAIVDRETEDTHRVDSPPPGLARDRWDVAIESVAGTVLVECGAIRDRVSQELARTVFDAVKRDIERRNGESR